MRSSLSGRRPQATTLPIEDLLEMVGRGEVRVPRFQRGLNWDWEDVRRLLDSIYHGYPIGNLLFWKKSAPAARLSFGPVVVEAPERRDALWVVDGQQRITSLVGVLLHPAPEGSQDGFAFYFDLETERFERSSRRAAPPAHWLPMNRVIDVEVLLDWLERYTARSKHPDHVQRARLLNKILREYAVPVYIVETEEESIVREIFRRMNSYGKRLKDEQVFHALHGGLSVGQPSDLHAVSERLRALRFGPIEERWLLKALLALKGLDLTRDFREQLEQHHAGLVGVFQDLERAMGSVLVFLQRDVGIPHISLLPYRFVIPPLARFFHLYPEPGARSRDLLARWVWRGAITGAHRGESIPLLRRTLAAIGVDEERDVQALLRSLPPGLGRQLEHHAFSFKSAHTKLQVNALIALGPRHLLTGRPLDVAAVLEASRAEALVPLIASPRGRSGVDTEEQGASRELLAGLANRIFHPPISGSPTRLLPPEHLQSDNVLRSHALDWSALTELSSGSVHGFLERRRQMLEAHVMAFLNARAKWDDTDRPSLGALVVADDEE